MDTRELTYKMSQIKKFPQVEQETSYSCGPACVLAICKYFKKTDYTEKYIIKKCGSTPSKGTSPKELLQCLSDMGFKAYKHNNMGTDLLKKYIELKIPVICAIQAHGDKEDKDKLSCGHYVVVIGYSNNKFEFEDPYTTNKVERNEKEFIKYWKDKDTKGKLYYQLGIAVAGKK